MKAISPLPGWRIDDAKLVASIRWHRSWPVFYAFAVLWNLGLPLVVKAPQSFEIIGYLAAVLFGVMALRALASRTTMRFDARAFVVETPLAFWQRSEFPLDDIAGFEARTLPTNVTSVFVRLKSAPESELPIDWQPLAVSMRGSNKQLFVASAEDAQWLARELGEMLATARQLGHDSYRT